MAKHLLHHATFTGAATKKARLLQTEAADTAAAFFSNSKPTLMKAEPWDASDFQFSGCNGSHDLSAASSAGAVRRDHGNNRRPSRNSHQEFTTVPYYDGREWRKYGEKNISGLDFPRCYYRCTYSPCPAKKRVEQISHDYPPMYLVTYEKEHTCNVSSVGTNSLPPAAAAAAATAPKADLEFLPSATQVHESIVIEQKHSPSTPSTVTDGSLGETCSLLDQSTLPELSTLESVEMVNYHELTSFLPYSSPELPILSDLLELESMETANPPILSDLLELESMETANRQESIIPPSSGAESPSPSYFPDLAALESMITAANFDVLDLAGAGDMHGFLELDNLVFDDPACFDSSYLDVLDPLVFDDVDSLNPLWSWS